MLSASDNELLCRVGTGTAMGNLMREYWTPALPSAELPSPDCPPMRMRLFGENLILFRDSEGVVGCVAEACPHRGASLFFGRNEEAGLRCVYHGWKFDVTGQCVDMPSEPAESGFKHKVRVRAYPARDVNHMVWVYMGPRATPPPFPAFEINTLPIENVAPPSIMMEEANWLQNLEGDLDSAHIDWLHSRLAEDSPVPQTGLRGLWTNDKQPRLDVLRTDYGAVYTGTRNLDKNAGTEWHRINQFIFPFHTMITAGDFVILRSFVPLDDEWTMMMTQVGSASQALPTSLREGLTADPFESIGGFLPRTSDPRSYYRTIADKSNDYLRNYAEEKRSMICGIPLVGNLQDRAMTELMTGENGEPIYDRRQEHLGTTDAMVIAVRRQLLRAARLHAEQGVAPANLDNVQLDRVRPATVILPRGADWFADAARYLDADAGSPVANDVDIVPSDDIPPPPLASIQARTE